MVQQPEPEFPHVPHACTQVWCVHPAPMHRKHARAYVHATHILWDRGASWSTDGDVQVLELWEDTGAAARARPVDDRHYVRVLFNGREVAVPPETTDPSEPLTLAQFKHHVLRPYALTEEEHAERCMMTFEHETRGGAPVDTSAIM